MIDAAIILAGIQAATAAIQAGAKALDALNNGDETAAKAYLAQARTHFDSARAAWDAAPGPSI
jgi:hypothetical protein